MFGWSTRIRKGKREQTSARTPASKAPSELAEMSIGGAANKARRAITRTIAGCRRSNITQKLDNVTMASD